MSKVLDPFMEYAKSVDPHNRQKLRCNMCGKEMMGGTSRLKYHLAQLARHELDICKNSTPKIIHRGKLAIEGIGKRKDEREALRQELGMRAALGSGTAGHTLEGVGSETLSSSFVMPSTTHSISHFLLRSGLGGQPGIKSMYKIKEKNEADKLVGRCLLWSDIPFHFARNHSTCLCSKLLLLLGRGMSPPLMRS